MNRNILHVRSGMTVGGPEQVLLAGMDELRGRYAFTVASFVLPDRDNQFLAEAKRRGFPVHPIHIRHSFDTSALPQLQQTLADTHLVVAHDYRALGLTLSALRKMSAGTKLPVVAVSHGWTAHTWKVRIYEWLERRWYRQAAAIVAVSRSKEAELLNRGFSRNQVTLIENGVRIPAQPTAEERRTIRAGLGIGAEDLVLLTVGRLSPEKSQRDLLDAVAALRHDFPLLRCYLVGDGPLNAALTAQCERLALQAQVIFTGWRSDTEKWYAAADLFIMTSLTEGLPMALLEAQSHALPAITTTVGGCGDVINDGITGMLVPVNDHTALVAALRKGLSDEAWRTQAGMNARARITERYSAVRYAADWQKLYDRILPAG